MRDDFATKTHCDRCSGDLASDDLTARARSHFSDDVLCIPCYEGEFSIQASIKKAGLTVAANNITAAAA